jgi:hypothetical protein
MKTNSVTQFVGKNYMVTSDCIAIAFFRPLTSNAVSINGIPLEAGQTLSINQNVGDLDVTQYQVMFTAGASTNELYVVRTLVIG